MPLSKASLNRPYSVDTNADTFSFSQSFREGRNSEKNISYSTIIIIAVILFFGANALNSFEKENEAEKMAQDNWEVCLSNYTAMACSVGKQNTEQKKQCEDALDCLQKGFDKPLSLNLFDALGVTIKETASIGTIAAILGLYFLL